MNQNDYKLMQWLTMPPALMLRCYSQPWFWVSTSAIALFWSSHAYGFLGQNLFCVTTAGVDDLCPTGTTDSNGPAPGGSCVSTAAGAAAACGAGYVDTNDVADGGTCELQLLNNYHFLNGTTSWTSDQEFQTYMQQYGALPAVDSGFLYFSYAYNPGAIVSQTATMPSMTTYSTIEAQVNIQDNPNNNKTDSFYIELLAKNSANVTIASSRYPSSGSTAAPSQAITFKTFIYRDVVTSAVFDAITSVEARVSGIDEGYWWGNWGPKIDYFTLFLKNTGGPFSSPTYDEQNNGTSGFLDAGSSMWTTVSSGGVTYLASQSGAQYANNLNDSSTPSNKITTQTIAVSGVNIALDIITWYDVESYYDWFMIEISTDGGTTWSGVSSVTGTESAWTTHIYDLTGLLIGATSFQLRFKLTSDGSGVRSGVKIDRFAIRQS